MKRIMKINNEKKWIVVSKALIVYSKTNKLSHNLLNLFRKSIKNFSKNAWNSI